MKLRSEDTGCGDQRTGSEAQRPLGTKEEEYLGWKENRNSTADSGLVYSRRTSLAVSASVYSRSISGVKRD